MLLLPLMIALIAVALAGLNLAVAQKRHARARRKFARLERRNAELLGLLKATAARAIAPRASSDATHAPTLRSEFGEDLLLLELFQWKPHGFYIEVGAYDGRRYAVTSALEELGWRGLLIEPVPELCEQARANRPHAEVVNAAVSRKGSTGTAAMTHILPSDDPAHDNAPDASSHLDASSGNLTTNRPPRGNERTIEVPLTTVDDLLGGHDGAVDFISIDVEGHELDLLDGFDLDRFEPAAILIEDHAMRDDSPIAAHLRSRGYTHTAWFAWNRLFVRSDRPELLDRAANILQHLEMPPSHA